MKLEQVINNNNELQSEASKFLKVLELVEALSKFGRIDLGGSYVYGTMVDRDIDIAVLKKT